MINQNSLLAIDPGLILGYAYFPEGKMYPTHVGIIKSKIKEKDFVMQAHNVATQYTHLLVTYAPRTVAIEWPAVYGSLSGRAAAGSGSVVKLAFTVGKLAQIVEDYGAFFVPIEVNKWKGQLSKKIVIKRIKRIISSSRLKKLAPEKDAWDAIGIGLFMRGLFK